MTHLAAKNKPILKVNKDNIEWFFIALFFILSFFHYGLLIVFFGFLIILLMQKEVGAIKVINLLTLRGILNPGIAISLAQFQNVKWFLIIGCSLFLVLSFFKLKKVEREKIRNITIVVLVFAIYSIVVSFLFGSLPIVATFKIISFVLPFLGIIYGVLYTREKIDWLKWMVNLIGLIVVPSIFLILFPVGYLRNGTGFQGFTNHPNLFGIVITIFLALILTQSQRKTSNFSSNISLASIILFAFYFLVLTQSRTAFISSLVLLLIYLVFSNFNIKYKYIIVSFFSLIIFLIPALRNYLMSFFTDFIFKGNTNLLYSRENQVEGLLNNFLSNPLWGTGFQIPVLGIKSYEFSFDYLVEPGNLFLAVLSNGGIVGFTIFSIYMMCILFNNIRNFKLVGLLFVTPIIISMGEMVFFSTNNIGIWCYMCLAIYISMENKYS